jgi:class 3 adenylate cyclase
MSNNIHDNASGNIKNKIGALLLADVIGYTPRAGQLGDQITASFNAHFESTVKDLTQKHQGHFIKRIGDAVLVFLPEMKHFLDFVSELRELSKTMRLDVSDFPGDLRMVAHYGNFSFQVFEDKICDVTGPESIKVFRMEKHADNKYDVVVTEFLLNIINPFLNGGNINCIDLGPKELKGFDKHANLFKLIFPTPGEIDASNLLDKEMAGLEAKTKEIPVFGDLYPPMSMKDNFINLDIKTGLKEDERLDKEEDFSADHLMGVDKKRERGDSRGKSQGLPHWDVKTLYDKQHKGIILGLPGSGKTTILKYFAFREFEHNRQAAKDGERRVVLFIPCANIMSYKAWHGLRFPDRGGGDITLNIETALEYLAGCFLSKGKGEEEKEDRDLCAARRRVQQAYYQGRLTLLIDALDEADGKETKEGIVSVVKLLFPGEEQEKTKQNRIYLTSRYSERETYFSGSNAEALQPVFEVRSLDMEQLRDMARFFYGEKTELFKKFDDRV